MHQVMMSIKGVLLVYIKKFGINSERSFLTSLKKNVFMVRLKILISAILKIRKKTLLKVGKRKRKLGVGKLFSLAMNLS